MTKTAAGNSCGKAFLLFSIPARFTFIGRLDKAERTSLSRGATSKRSIQPSLLVLLLIPRRSSPLHRNKCCGMDYLQLTQTLTESFIALADEVQSLIDRKTILEHKLRFAHEQVR